MRKALLAMIFVLAPACAEFDAPSELSRPQILAVRATPPVVAPGGRTRLDVLVAGPGGQVIPASELWSANVVVDRAGAWLEVPASAPAEGAVEVSVAVALTDGTTLRALKSVVVAPTAAPNPRIDDVRVDGLSTSDAEPLRLAPDIWVALDLTVSPAPSEYAIYAWYCNAGDIDLYRRAPTDLHTASVPVQGSLFVVYRDGPGVDWREIGILVE